MAEKYTLQEINAKVEEHGYHLRNCKYENVKSKIEISDDDGYLYNVQAANLFSGRIPEKFRRTNKFTIRNLQHYITLCGSKTKVLSRRYVNAHTKLEFQCGMCGEKYESSLNHVVSRNQLICPQCSLKEKGVRHRVAFSDVINEFTQSGLTPMFTEYSGCDEKLLCCDKQGNKHKISYRALSQLNKAGYSDFTAKMSKYESLVARYLNEKNIQYLFQYIIDDCKDKSKLRFDFAVFVDTNVILIEIDGQQHYKFVKFSNELTHESFEELKKRDRIKDEYCYNHGIKLIRIPYYTFVSCEWKNIIEKEIRPI